MGDDSRPDRISMSAAAHNSVVDFKKHGMQVSNANMYRQVHYRNDEPDMKIQFQLDRDLAKQFPTFGKHKKNNVWYDGEIASQTNEVELAVNADQYEKYDGVNYGVSTYLNIPVYRNKTRVEIQLDGWYKRIEAGKEVPRFMKEHGTTIAQWTRQTEGYPWFKKDDGCYIRHVSNDGWAICDANGNQRYKID